jgi:N-acetylmuramoyl-L-alanine amidase
MWTRPAASFSLTSINCPYQKSTRHFLAGLKSLNFGYLMSESELKLRPAKERPAANFKTSLGMWKGTLAGQNFFHKVFARVSPVFTVLAIFFLCAHPGRAESSTTHKNSVKRQSAAAQYARAEELRSALNSKPADKRALAEYKNVVASYRRVYLITPAAAEVPDALLAVSELYTEMGDHFGRSYYQLAVDSYEFLLHEYPANHFAQDAMLRMAHLLKEQLGDSSSAAKTYEEFVKKYPRSQRKREAQQALAELALLQKGSESAGGGAATDSRTAEAAESSRVVPADVARAYATEHAGAAPHLRRITTNALADSTRVTIDLEDLVQYDSARIRNPDRIFFDLHTARIAPALARENFHVEGYLLTAVRVAQNQSGVVRVVLDVNGVKDYSASLLSNPPQLVIDLYPDSRASEVRSAKARHGKSTAVQQASKLEAEAMDEQVVQPISTAAAKADVVVSQGPMPAANPVSSGPMPKSGSLVPRTTAMDGKAKSRAKSAKALSPSSVAGDKPDLIQPTAPAQPTRDGQATLTRTLGLKIGRIVIDPGHGGHDTGTIGPTGLMEKDLCLDIAVRLGKIIQQRLPGAEVVFTRSDDTFIPLEERTRVANESRADLFISIHANSSQDRGARGIETYYLNLKGSPDSMEVAARENATSQESIHDLEDMVKKIARSEKIDESREFAADIQESLAKRIAKASRTVKDRGVRKAPFVVLIGADMPSILTEIAFLSNPADEQLLKKPEQRQKVAEGLYQGVASYLQSLNSMTLNLPTKSTGAVPVSSVEQSRNQR